MISVINNQVNDARERYFFDNFRQLARLDYRVWLSSCYCFDCMAHSDRKVDIQQISTFMNYRAIDPRRDTAPCRVPTLLIFMKLPSSSSFILRVLRAFAVRLNLAKSEFVPTVRAVYYPSLTRLDADNLY